MKHYDRLQTKGFVADQCVMLSTNKGSLFYPKSYAPDFWQIFDNATQPSETLLSETVIHSGRLQNKGKGFVADQYVMLSTSVTLLLSHVLTCDMGHAVI